MTFSQNIITKIIFPAAFPHEIWLWSGHSGAVGKNEYRWQDREYVLFWLGKRKKQALMNYRRYVAEGVRRGPRAELVGGIPGSDFGK
jgi:hypothetical protein